MKFNPIDFVAQLWTWCGLAVSVSDSQSRDCGFENYKTQKMP